MFTISRLTDQKFSPLYLFAHDEKKNPQPTPNTTTDPEQSQFLYMYVT